jgi:hypothetical protein
MDAPTANAVVAGYAGRTISTGCIWGATAYTLSHAEMFSRFDPSQALLLVGILMAGVSTSMYFVWTVQFPPKAMPPSNT